MSNYPSQKKVIKSSMKKNLVFHGTNLPVWTPSTELRPPAFDRPLFVADVPAIATSYIVNSKGSVFIFNLKVNPRRAAFDFSSHMHLAELAQELPLTSSLIEKCLDNRDVGFFMVSRLLETTANTILGGDEALDLDDVTNRERYDVLKELGLVLDDGRGGLDPSDELRAVSHGSGRVGTLGRRLIKSKVFKVINGLGYPMAMDKDSSAYQSKSGKEYALFDMGIIENGSSLSVNPAQAMQYSKKLYG